MERLAFDTDGAPADAQAKWKAWNARHAKAAQALTDARTKSQADFDRAFAEQWAAAQEGRDIRSLKTTTINAAVVYAERQARRANLAPIDPDDDKVAGQDDQQGDGAEPGKPEEQDGAEQLEELARSVYGRRNAAYTANIAHAHRR